MFESGFPFPIGVPPALGSPLYQLHCAPVPKVPPLTERSTWPLPQIELGIATIEDGLEESVLIVTVIMFDVTEEQFELTSLLKQVFWVVPNGGSYVALFAPKIST